ncbi:MAG: hypothetical protein RL033_1130 [Pseudomonadota bacterium]
MRASNILPPCALIAGLLGSSLPGCASSSQLGPQAAAIASARVQSQTNPYRPRLTLVEREGDPQRGLALAVHVAGAAPASTLLAWLAEGRLRGAGFSGLSTRASSDGFVLYALVEELDRVARFIQEGNRALVTPLSARDAEYLLQRLASEPARVARSSSEAAVAQCSGVPLLTPGTAGRPSPGEIAGWLEAVRVNDVAFAAVGSQKYLDAADAASASLAPWSRLGSGGWRVAEGDRVGSVASQGPLSLSVALGGASSARVLAAAEHLAEPGSLLATRMGAGFPAWQVERVSTHLDGGSACLRVDLQSAAAAPSVDAVARSAWNAVDELEHTLARVNPGPWVIARQVLAAEAPHEAAAVAAWQALNARDTGAPVLRRLVHYNGDLAGAVGADPLPVLFNRAGPSDAGGVEMVHRVEPGQASFWMLLASPCGTSAEDTGTAGTLALAMHATALAATGRDGVVLEPWLSADAVGILAHTTATAAEESPVAQAERVAEALARALLRSGPTPEAIAASREVLLGTLDDGPNPALSLALRQVSANRPSWLDARGTWSTLSALSARSVELQRQAFLRGRLRLASVGNHDETQVAAAEQRLKRLLHGAESGRAICPARRPVLPASGKYRVESAGARSNEAIIAVPLPAMPEGLPAEAQWTELLLNRTGGWLSQALQQPGLVSTARARALGGSGAAALVIEVRALDGKREEAVAQVRGLLERLRLGAATSEDAQLGQVLLQGRAAELALNPRGRVLDVWRGARSQPRSGSLEGLRALHRAAFEGGREIVVLTDPPQ